MKKIRSVIKFILFFTATVFALCGLVCRRVFYSEQTILAADHFSQMGAVICFDCQYEDRSYRNAAETAVFSRFKSSELH